MAALLRIWLAGRSGMILENWRARVSKSCNLLTQEDMIALSDKRMSASAMQSRYIAPSAPDKLIVEPEVLCGLAERIRNALLAHPIRVGKIIEFGEGARV